MTISSIGRMLAPTVFGSVFSWSLTNITSVGGIQQPGALGFPLNQYFVFFLQSFWVLLVAVICMQFPESMDQKRSESSTKDEEEEEGKSSVDSSSTFDDETKWRKTYLKMSKYDSV